MNVIRRVSVVVGLLSIIMLTLVGVWEPTQTYSAPLSAPSQLVAEAWELAQISGSYRFNTTAEQTMYPAPALSNAGRAPETTNIDLAGRVNRHQELLEMTMWPNGRTTIDDPGLELKIEGDQAFARQTGGEWEAMENVTDLFAPGQDPLGFLSAAKNIQETKNEERRMKNETDPVLHSSFFVFNSSKRYSFELDGPALADFMRAQLEEQLKARGELPHGITIEAPEIYHETTGEGEIWLTEDGLPLRLTV